MRETGTTDASLRKRAWRSQDRPHHPGGGWSPRITIGRGTTPGLLRFSQRSYAQQNWLDHLHLVYTLPYLGRIDEAKAEVPVLLKLKPDISVREADRLYTLWCFDADFRE